MIDPEFLRRFAELPPELKAELYSQMTEAERLQVEAELLKLMADRDPLAGLGWRDWNDTVAPSYFKSEYAPEHVEFWEWTDTITADRPDPYLLLWPRGYTKSTCAEIAVVKFGAKRLRNYFLYVSHTQDQADDHVGTIGSILESDRIAEYYPALGAVKVNKFGSSKGWRRNRLRTMAGFTVDALGLDSAARGAKLDEERPDGMVLDDIDATHASTRVVERNIRTITQALIPALQPNKVIIMAQNLVAPGSIAARIADGRADMLGGAIKSGPFPLVKDMQAKREDGRWVISGVPAWPAGMDLQRCSDQMTDMGPMAFQIECQQDITERAGAIWRKKEIRYWDGELPEFDRVVVSVDPNKTGRSDDAGVVVIGRFRLPDGDFGAIVLEDCSKLSAPSEWSISVGRAAVKYHAGAVIVEKTGLGEHAKLTIKNSPFLKDYPISIEEVDAKLGKADRARPVWRLYVDNRVWHHGPLPSLEAQQTGWEPDEDPMSPGALDAVVHGITKLLIDVSGPPNMAVAS